MLIILLRRESRRMNKRFRTENPDFYLRAVSHSCTGITRRVIKRGAERAELSARGFGDPATLSESFAVASASGLIHGCHREDLRSPAQPSIPFPALFFPPRGNRRVAASPGASPLCARSLTRVFSQKMEKVGGAHSSKVRSSTFQELKKKRQ